MPEHRNPETLLRLHHDDGLSQRKMGDELGCSQKTVRRWMERLGVEKRDLSEAQSGRRNHTWVERASFYTHRAEGEVWTVHDSDESSLVTVHRLLAVAEYGFDAVKGMHVHHKNGVPWDNRPSNIELLTPEEHGRLHRKDQIRLGINLDGGSGES